MNCPSNARLAAWIDGDHTLLTKDAIAVEQHLAVCEDCRTVVARVEVEVLERLADELEEA